MQEALLGGVLIGVAVSIMLLFNGRVTGISGIVAGIIVPRKGDVAHRLAFIMGLVAGGVALKLWRPEALAQAAATPWSDYAIAGLLVGIGTLLGNGCTSGHGVCGISRFAPRSLVATVTFIVFGIFSVLIFRALRGTL